jgi:hypothetical protein
MFFYATEIYGRQSAWGCYQINSSTHFQPVQRGDSSSKLGQWFFQENVLTTVLGGDQKGDFFSAVKARGQFLGIICLAGANPTTFEFTATTPAL